MHAEFVDDAADPGARIIDSPRPTAAGVVRLDGPPRPGARFPMDLEYGGVIAYLSAYRSLTIRSWNASSLLASSCVDNVSLTRHRSKMRMLDRVVCGADVVLLQEVRGGGHDLTELDARYVTHVAYGSFLTGHTAGGIVFLVRKSLVRDGDCRLLEVVRGRIGILQVRSPELVVDVCNVHFFDDDGAAVLGQITALRDHMPPASHVLWLGSGLALNGPCPQPKLVQLPFPP